MTKLKFTAVGDGLGLVFPPEVLSHLQASDGDEIRLVQTPNGAILQKVDAETAKQIEIASDVMDRRRDALRRLAE
ncbi:MAG: AbrB/MazE/SpoVT family DNA-binding domain-containing protein [Planctomycetota bacterium]